MRKHAYFRTATGTRIPLPVFFPDATKGVIRTLDSRDIESTKTQGILVNTYHLMKHPGQSLFQHYGGIRQFMDWRGGVISDSGGFQVGSLVKKNPQLGTVTDKGVRFKFPGQQAMMITPESSMRFQMALHTDMVVVLDDFDAPNATEKQARESVERTIRWARRAKTEYTYLCEKNSIPRRKRPYILGVIQGGRSKELRKYCMDALVDIGFDGLGYGGEEKVKGAINLDLAQYLSGHMPAHYFRYALGVGKPEDIVAMARIGWDIFDCVLPTRDARHKRLYIYNADTIAAINPNDTPLYTYHIPDKQAYRLDKQPVSTACDCLLCTHYTRGYLYHLFKENEMTAMRLATIHNLRFYAILMEKLQSKLQHTPDE